VQQLVYYVTTIRSRNPEQQTMAKIKETRDLLEATYKALKPSLAKIGEKKLKELAEQRRENGLKL